jgi:hypothetical protein
MLWLPIDEAISLAEKDNTTDYEGKFIQQREVIFLKKARQMIKTDSKLKKINFKELN